MEAAVGEEKRRIVEQREEMEKSVDEIREGYKQREAGLEVRSCVRRLVFFFPFFFVEKNRQKRTKTVLYSFFCFFVFFHSMLCFKTSRSPPEVLAFCKIRPVQSHISCTLAKTLEPVRMICNYYRHFASAILRVNTTLDEEQVQPERRPTSQSCSQ